MRRRGYPFDIVGKSASVAVMATALCLCAPSAMAQDLATPEAETPWYEAFTLSMNESPHPELAEIETFDWESAGGRWGITLGIDDHSDTRIAREDLSAGAFVNLGDRFRFGGQLRFASPDSEYFTLRGDSALQDRREPEIKFESALRF